MTTPCVCPVAQYCKTHKRNMKPHGGVRWKLCREQPGYFEAFQKDRSRGVGDTLKKILDKTGLSRLKGDCGGCQKRQEKLNEMFPYE